MHILDSADSVGGIYVPGPPKTVIGRHMLNALVQEVLGVLSAGNITPRASGAADAAANYTGQLTQAIRELGFRSLYQDYTVTATFDALMTEPTNPNTTIRLISGGTDYPHQTIAMSDAIGNSKKLRIVYNATPTRKFISVQGGVVPIMPGYAVTFLAVNYTTTTPDDTMRWQPLDGKVLRPISLKAYFNGNVCDAGVVYGFWWADGAIAYLHVPKIDVRISGAAISLDYEDRMGLYIADGAFPFFETGNFAFPTDSFTSIIHVNAGNGDALMSAYYTADGTGVSGYDRSIGLRPFPALTPIGINFINSQVIQIPIFDNPIP
jgi:hypothetical protein